MNDGKAFRITLVSAAILAVALFMIMRTPDSNSKTETAGKVTIFNATTGKLEEMDKVVKTDEEWKEILTPEQYQITRGKGTERAYTGKYDKFKEKGIYKCVNCGTDLFSSDAKFDSGTGWPSFWEPISPHNVATKPDNKLFFIKRTEVLCQRCDAHLGHVFKDGPPPTGLRYCMNSVALNFVKRTH